jgi:hypothetical protein
MVRPVCAAFVAVVITTATCQSTPPASNAPAQTAALQTAESNPTEQQKIRQTLFDELKPVALKNCALTRVGSAHDGGYVMCGNLISGAEAAYSYGIGSEDNWGCAIATALNRPVHQYDCFTPSRPQCATGRSVFHAECVGAKQETVDNRPFDTVSNQIAHNGDTTKRLIVKLDVEGAEWDALVATPDSVLEAIDQLPMELHWVDEQRMIDAVRKLKRTFYLANLHFNNWACSPDVAPFLGRAFQVLWVNKRLTEPDPARSAPSPTRPPNAPDNPKDSRFQQDTDYLDTINPRAYGLV